MASANTGKDLPMSANTKDITVKHFVLDLTCKMGERILEGSIVLFCCPAQHGCSSACPSNINTGDGYTRRTGCQDSCLNAHMSDVSDGNAEHANRAPRMQSDCAYGTHTSHSAHGAHDNSLLLDISDSGPVRTEMSTHTDSGQKYSEHNLENDHSKVSGSANATAQEHMFNMVLDCYQLDIHKVEGIFLCEQYKMLLQTECEVLATQLTEGKLTVESIQQRRQVMSFSVEEHCVRVCVDGVQSVKDFPNAVQIWYSTKPDGPSLRWTTDQDGNPCVFTIGHFLSNRSLFPSQDVPSALPTWQATVTVELNYTVLMTGDFEPEITSIGESRKFAFYTNFPMPSCTFAIAVGSWNCEVLTTPSQQTAECLTVPPVRLFSPACVQETATALLAWYLPLCFLEVQSMLGAYPFHRLDILIVPACFDSLGMANPSLLFLSQSVLCPDGSMCVRVAHELCHTWFGLVIGPLDWTEEWLTEGFCTYLEDMLHAKVCQMGEKAEEYLRLRKELNLRVLKGELENTDQELQSLRPNQGKASDPSEGTGETRFLKNGMNPEKKFMQVHYLKGYFLLHALEDAVGRVKFLSFLKDYVQTFIYQLVTSQDFLQMFFQQFHSELNGTALTLNGINATWLDCPGMPELTPTQVILLFDQLLKEERLPGLVLELLRDTHGTHLLNPEVCHRWCELVIKHKHRKCYPAVREFFIQHQAMGVYLYGEAMIYKCPEMMKIARTCFLQLQHDMPDAVVETVSAMLFPK
ncbi:hypothetical protein BaRGS_00000382 [Batillaria attramentaria]|uniref:Peptidase M1 leukotriene A4 hydrolase/aminopeptidase C-terminal domain-containing protein n=1 Tax=Batillaria attramentaria TaxID=370345 RepID=A0ABD0MA74_9CAEN